MGQFPQSRLGIAEVASRLQTRQRPKSDHPRCEFAGFRTEEKSGYPQSPRNDGHEGTSTIRGSKQAKTCLVGKQEKQRGKGPRNQSSRTPEQGGYSWLLRWVARGELH